MAQRFLYEGVEIGSTVGLTPTCAVPGFDPRLPWKAFAEYIGDTYGADYRPVPVLPEIRKGPRMPARPHDVNRTPAMLKPFLTPMSSKIPTPSSGSVFAALFDLGFLTSRSEPAAACSRPPVMC